MKKLLAACAVVLASASAPASAVTIIYTVSGVFSGTLNGTSFSDTGFTFTGIGNTDDAQTPISSVTTVALSSLKAVSNGITYSLASGYSFFVSRMANTGTVGFSNGTSDVIDATTAAGASYFGTTSLASTASTLANSTSFSTSHAAVSLADASSLSFSALIGVVPEPETWMLMIAGFGMIGFAARRRMSATVATRA